MSSKKKIRTLYSVKKHKEYDYEKSAKSYQEYIHTKYDWLLTKINKLPNAEVDNAFYEGLKACIHKDSDMPYFQDFYDYYFTKYNVDSLINIAYSLPTKERRMCRDLIVSSIYCRMDNFDKNESQPNKNERVIELSDIYYEIRIKKDMWYGDDTDMKTYLKRNYADRILNATYPLTGFMTTKKQEKNLKQMYPDYDCFPDRKRFFRLIREVFDELLPPVSHEECVDLEESELEREVSLNVNIQQVEEKSTTTNETIQEKSRNNTPIIAKTLSSNKRTDSVLIHDTTNIDALDLVNYESSEEVELSIDSSHKESETKKRKLTVRQKGDVDYAEQQKISQKIGDTGEELVLQNEIEKLTKLGLPAEIISKVRRVSIESDDYGFDILSFDEYGNERYLEVKTTKVNKQDFSFILTQNELEHAKELGKQYCIVIVFDILRNPRIWYMGNPFIEEPYKIRIKPMQYRVDVSTL